MVEFELENDEGIIIQTEECTLLGEKEIDIQEMILTNKNVICGIRIKSGIFSKSEIQILKYPLSSIKIVDGKPQVMQTKKDGCDCLQLVIDNRRVCIFFHYDFKKEIIRWINAINVQLLGNDDKNIEEKKSKFFDRNQKTLQPVMSEPKVEKKGEIKDNIKEEQPTDRLNRFIHCAYCGGKNKKNAKFCCNCGKAMKKEVAAEKSNTGIREQYVGTVKKCPSCGEKITGFIVFCPACGHELNSSTISDTLGDFISQVDICERIIAGNPKMKSGWVTWSTSKKAWWVIFNILFACIPLMIYWGYPLISIKSTPKLNKDEQQLASLIENFPVPNDRESILEVLVYIKEKIDFISKESIDRKSAYWMREWCSKAEQLREKADIFFPNDAVVRSCCKEIAADQQTVNNKIKIKAGIGMTLFIIAIVFALSRNGTLEEIKMSNTVLEIPVTELSVLMPQIEGGKGKIQTNNSYFFSVEYYGITEKEFEKYKKSCENAGYIIDCESNGSLFDAYNDEGYNIRITYYSKKMHITISDKEDMRTIIWPENKATKQVPVPKSDYGSINSSSDSCVITYIGNTTKDDFAEYVNKCIEMGFTKDSSQTDNHYHADNEEGYHVLIEYRGYNTMFLRIDD